MVSSEDAPQMDRSKAVMSIRRYKELFLKFYTRSLASDPI